MIDFFYQGLTRKQVQSIDNEKERLKVACKVCGRRKVIPVYVDRLLCDWCNHWIYREPNIEFKYKLEEQLKKER